MILKRVQLLTPPPTPAPNVMTELGCRWVFPMNIKKMISQCLNFLGFKCNQGLNSSIQHLKQIPDVPGYQVPLQFTIYYISTI